MIKRLSVISVRDDHVQQCEPTKTKAALASARYLRSRRIKNKSDIFLKV